MPGHPRGEPSAGGGDPRRSDQFTEVRGYPYRDGLVRIASTVAAALVSLIAIAADLDVLKDLTRLEDMLAFGY